MIRLEVIEASERLTHVALAGRLDVVGTNEIDLDFTRQVAIRRKPTIVDLSEVNLIASIGMGLLVRNAKTLMSHGSPMFLVGAHGIVDQALRAASLDQVMPMHATVEEGVAALGVEDSGSDSEEE